ncbi:hypothetical protein GW17_00039903 [Ensete ventricosum]|nr:hypothetical protein GW17_00039903 [Ensete ventricosum]RZR95629.1 hypothetical protein BHM03_00024506 [Ensete ventricosum]
MKTSLVTRGCAVRLPRITPGPETTRRRSEGGRGWSCVSGSVGRNYPGDFCGGGGVGGSE